MRCHAGEIAGLDFSFVAPLFVFSAKHARDAKRLCAAGASRFLKVLGCADQRSGAKTALNVGLDKTTA